tara:strand:- start:14737 stop:15021 length:285 start_codon:yes stop_codon:yes gene_type:complete
MPDSKDKDFNETLKRLMEAPPKPHEEMKKGRRIEHFSDCALHNLPALKNGPCSCGGLYLAGNSSHGGVAPLVPVPGCAGWLVDNVGRGCFVKSH